MSAGGEITQFLRHSRDSRPEALNELYRLVYDELRRIARRQRARHSRPPANLETTALVHEAFLKFQRVEVPDFADREHFYAVAAQAMRQLLVDQARRDLRQRRGGDALHVELAEEVSSNRSDDSHQQLLDLNDALEELAATSPRVAEVAQCKIFSGMSEEEIAVVIGTTARTVRRDWAKARAFLSIRLE